MRGSKNKRRGSKTQIQCPTIVIPGVDDMKHTAPIDEPEVERMKGFEINRPTYQMSPINPGSLEWKLAEHAAEHAAEIQGQTTPLEYKQLVKATLEIVAGVIYYLTFTAIDINDQVERIYRAKVWAKVPVELECLFFEELKACTVPAEEIRRRIMAILPKESKSSTSLVTMSSVLPETRVIEPTNKEIMVNGRKSRHRTPAGNTPGLEKLLQENGAQLHEWGSGRIHREPGCSFPRNCACSFNINFREIGPEDRSGLSTCDSDDA